MRSASTTGRRHILITGLPGVGKTTLITSLIEKLPGTKSGFFTREVRERGTRKGFLIETLDGKTAPLADVGSGGSLRVGTYRILVESIDRVAVGAITAGTDFVIIDEIGKMESVSERFVRAVDGAFVGGSTVIATIARHGNRFIEEIKRRPDVRLFEVTRENRDSLAEVILKELARSGFEESGWPIPRPAR